jgi:hypothetical protein
VPHLVFELLRAFRGECLEFDALRSFFSQSLPLKKLAMMDNVQREYE